MTLKRTIGTTGYDLSTITLQDLSSMGERDLASLHLELQAAARALHENADGSLRDKSEAESGQFRRYLDLIDGCRAHSAIRSAASNPRAVVRGDGAEFAARADRPRAAGQADVPPRVAEDRDRAFRIMDEYSRSGVLSAAAGDRLDDVLRAKDAMGGTARYLTAAGDPAYATAFGKMAADPMTGHLRFDPAEVEAVRAMGHVMSEMRAMGEATGGAGQFALPLQIDPSIILTSAGALNPVRDVASVETIGAYQWRGVASDGITAAYVAEGTEAADASPASLVQPTLTPQRAQAFVPFSIELSMDWAALQSELVRLVTDARNVLDSTMFLTGSGTSQPSGILNIGALNGLTTTQRVQTATTAVTAVGDPWAFKAAIPARWLNSTTFAAAPATFDAVYRFVAQGSTTEPRQFANGDRGGDFLGRPKIEWSTMATTLTTTGAKILIGGDFRTGFKIVDRIGMQAEFIPHIFGLARGYPTGQRGLYCYWRTSSGVVAPNALRYLEVK